MKPHKRIVVVAGEESGDKHAATFIKELLATNPHLQISGIGGQHMQEAGVDLISDLARHGVTGVSEVIQHAVVIRRAYQAIKTHLQTAKPDLLILVDYPGFNLRLAKYAKQVLGIQILYYISPQIWAWKANRIHTIRANVDKMAVILPFEKAIYEKAQVPVAFVGHPLVKNLVINKAVDALKLELGLPLNKQLIAMLPGSRTNEIERLMPVLRDTAMKLLSELPDLHIVIPVARSVKRELIESHLATTTLPFTLIQEQAVETVHCSDFAVVASGTASLECALLGKPMCIIYKVSKLTAIAAAKLVRIQYSGLCNLLENKMIVPELLQYDCTATELTRCILDIMKNPERASHMVQRLERLKNSLSNEKSDCTISALIESMV